MPLHLQCRLVDVSHWRHASQAQQDMWWDQGHHPGGGASCCLLCTALGPNVFWCLPFWWKGGAYEDSNRIQGLLAAGF